MESDGSKTNIIRNLFIVILFGLLLYLVMVFSDSRDKAYYWGYILSRDDYFDSRWRHHYTCKVKLENGHIVEAICAPNDVINTKVQILKIQTFGDYFAYTVIYSPALNTSPSSRPKD